MRFRFRAVEALALDDAWARHFGRFWDTYREWFLSDGDAARPSFLESRAALRRHMPELVPTYERVCDLAGGGDVAARFLSLYRPPAYVSGCSQAVWIDDGEPVLVRNYDYHPRLLEGVCLHSRWNGRSVIAMSDCLWGVVDGMNQDGLALALAFGGSRAVGDGFGMPLILRYVLETCSNVAEACDLLVRVPSHMAYNVTVTDATGDFRTVQVAPGADAVVRKFPVATNHQGSVEWMAHAHATQTLERERFLYSRFADRNETVGNFIDAFLRPPLYSKAFRQGYGTLYTAIYRPRSRSLELRWPDHSCLQSLARFEPREWTVQLTPS